MKKKMSNRDKTFWAVVIPVVVLFFAFNTLPMIKGVIYSFTNYKGYGSYDYVGLRNYTDLFTDARVGKSYLFTFKYAIAGTVLVNVLSLVMAVALNSNIRGKSALRGVYFVPNILGGLVIGYIFSFIFTYILPVVGNTFNIGFLQNSILASEKYAWIGVLIVGVWQAVAMNTIIYISGLQTVPEDVYEASMLDGAGKWKQFWKVTFPLVMPFVTINLVLSTKNFLMVFDQIMSLTKGGPAQSTESISYLIYRNGMDGGQFGFQSANAVIFFVVIVAISLFQMGVMNKKEETVIMKKQKTNWVLTIVLILGTLTVFFPLYMAVIIAFKKPSEMTNDVAGALSFPSKWSFSNFTEAMKVTDFWHSLGNSLLITIVTIVLAILIHSIAGYVIGRGMARKKSFRFIYLYIVSGMFVPFSILMMPLVKQTAQMGLGNRAGVIILYLVFYMPMNVLLYSGYLKNIPMALEEAADIDGASTWTTYWRVVFPMMKPMHATVAILTALGTWNDVMTPLVIMSGTGQNTLPLAQLNFQTQFGTNYNLAFASYILALIPILIFYIICQKQILNGVANGAIKG